MQQQILQLKWGGCRTTGRWWWGLLFYFRNLNLDLGLRGSALLLPPSFLFFFFFYFFFLERMKMRIHSSTMPPLLLLLMLGVVVIMAMTTVPVLASTCSVGNGDPPAQNFKLDHDHLWRNHGDMISCFMKIRPSMDVPPPNPPFLQWGGRHPFPRK